MNSNVQNEEADDNITLQMEELEALSSIYGEDFVLEDEVPPTFTVSIRLNNGEMEASLMISFEPGYPTSAPPIYQLSIPWIRGDHKKAIIANLEELYLDHIGESIVYIWVEKLREVLEEEQQDHKSHEERDLEKEEDGNASQQEKNPISDKLIASVSRLDCSDSTITTTNNQNTQKYNSSPTTTAPHSFPSASHENKTLVGCKIPKITTGEPLTDRKSTFQAHLTPIQEVFQVRVVLDELYKNKKIASATHNMYAYRIFKKDTGTWIQDCEDDGETHAGSRLLHLLQILDCRNILVVVTRWYGGIQLHADRFKHINNVARQLLDREGVIKKSSAK